VHSGSSKYFYLLDPASRNVFVLANTLESGWITDVIRSHLNATVDRIRDVPVGPL